MRVGFMIEVRFITSMFYDLRKLNRQTGSQLKDAKLVICCKLLKFSFVSFLSTQPSIRLMTYMYSKRKLAFPKLGYFIFQKSYALFFSSEI